MVAFSPAAPLAHLASWEATAVEATGLDAAFLRYVTSFFLAVPVGWGWRCMPTPRGEIGMGGYGAGAPIACRAHARENDVRA